MGVVTVYFSMINFVDLCHLYLQQSSDFGFRTNFGFRIFIFISNLLKILPTNYFLYYHFV